jgi:hypothetical protein
MREKFFAEIPKKSIAAYRPAPVGFCSFQFARAHGPDKAGARQQKEVIAVMNINVNFGQHADLGMPVFGRVRVASLRAFPMTTGAVKSIAGQKCALMDQTQVLDGYRVVAGLSVATGAFPGTSVWSPPI